MSFHLSRVSAVLLLSLSATGCVVMAPEPDGVVALDAAGAAADGLGASAAAVAAGPETEAALAEVRAELAGVREALAALTAATEARPARAADAQADADNATLTAAILLLEADNAALEARLNTRYKGSKVGEIRGNNLSCRDFVDQEAAQKFHDTFPDNRQVLSTKSPPDEPNEIACQAYPYHTRNLIRKSEMSVGVRDAMHNSNEPE